MEPLIIKSQLTANEYSSLNLRVMWKRLRVFVILVIIMLGTFYYTNYLNSDQGDKTLLWLSLYFLVLFLLLPLINIFSAGRQYKKIKALSEPKIYQFTDKGIQIEGITTSTSMDWSNINRATDRKKEMVIGLYNSKSFVVLKKTDFTDNQQLQALKDLIKVKNVKNNFKS